MTHNFPMTVVATLGDVTICQTAAFNDADMVSNDIRLRDRQQMRQIGQPSYGKGNVGLHVNDHAKKVLDNRMHLLATINQHLTTRHKLPIESLHWVNQVHGKQIYDVDNNPLSMQPVDADALVSEQPGVGLAVMTADCVPIVLYQPNTGKIAAIHAGWQGLACGVIKTTAERFTQSEQIIAWIGVSISQINYEVDSQVSDKLLTGCITHRLLSDEYIQKFNKLFCSISSATLNPIDKSLQSDVDKCKDNVTISSKKVNVDLPKIAAYQLLSLGIEIGNDGAGFYETVPCSYANEQYYSYRRQSHLQQPATGRMALIITRSSTASTKHVH